MDRYSRQTLFAAIGPHGQRQLSEKAVVVVGCGALGTVASQLLVRAGVGAIRIVDRDVPDLSNLQRQVLFDEDDVAAGIPKAEVARQKLSRVNSEVEIEAAVADLTADNADLLLRGADVVVDGTDNFLTRLLVNDWAVENRTPWIYCGVISSQVHTMAILPGRGGPCFRCYLGDLPPSGSVETCETAGVIGPAVEIGASYAVIEAIKLLVGRREEVDKRLLILDVWERLERKVAVPKVDDCPCCGQGNLEFLRGERSDRAAVLCGRNAVQVSPATATRLDLEAVERDLGAVASEVRRNAFLLRAKVEDVELTVFPDGRAIVKGTEDEARARTVYARYVGS